jgi:hypothetical protein
MMFVILATILGMIMLCYLALALAIGTVSVICNAGDLTKQRKDEKLETVDKVVIFVILFVLSPILMLSPDGRELLFK